VEPTPFFIQRTQVPSNSVVPSASNIFPSASSIFPSASGAFPSASSAVTFSYEVTTSNPDDEETTTNFDRAEVRVTSSTTESVGSTTEEATTTETPEETTSLPINPNKEELDEALNEIERGRKVAGRPQDQIIVDEKKEIKTTLEKPTEVPVEQPEVEEDASLEDQTVYVTKTVPTTVYRTYTYFT
jgi:hypothetical protein